MIAIFVLIVITMSALFILAGFDVSDCFAVVKSLQCADNGWKFACERFQFMVLKSDGVF